MAQPKNKCRMVRCAAEAAEHAFGDHLFQTVGIWKPNLHGRRVDHDRAGEDDWRTWFWRSDNIVDNLAIDLTVDARYSAVAQREIYNYVAVSDQVLRVIRIGNLAVSTLQAVEAQKCVAGNVACDGHAFNLFDRAQAQRDLGSNLTIGAEDRNSLHGLSFPAVYRSSTARIVGRQLRALNFEACRARTPSRNVVHSR